MEEVPEKSSGDDSFASPIGASRLGQDFSLEDASGLGAKITVSDAQREQRVQELRQQEEEQDILIRELRVAVKEKEIQELRRRLEQRTVENEPTIRIDGGMKAGAPGPYHSSSPSSPLGSYQGSKASHEQPAYPSPIFISPAAKIAERALSAKPLDTGDPSKAFLWLSQGLQYYKWGGSHFLGAFLSSSRLGAFVRYLSKIYQDFKPRTGIALSVWYTEERRDWSTDEDCPFIQDYTLFVVHENAMSEKNLLDHIAMPELKKFDHVAINDFLANISTAVRMFWKYQPSRDSGKVGATGIPVQKQIMKAMSGFRPLTFSRKLLDDNPTLYSETWEEFEKLVSTLSLNMQTQRNLTSEGYGEDARSGDRTVDRSAGSVTSLADWTCQNCKLKGHKINDCSQKCTKCVPSCGQVPSKCPRFLALQRTFKGGARGAFSAELRQTHFEANAASAALDHKKKVRQLISDKTFYNNNSYLHICL